MTYLIYLASFRQIKQLDSFVGRMDKLSMQTHLDALLVQSSDRIDH